MANRTRVLTVGSQRAELERRVRSQAGTAREARRARIVLLASEGLPAAEIAVRVGCSEPTVTKWRTAWVREGLSGLQDSARSGRPPLIDDAKRRVWIPR